jgi:hypothetical protein
MQTQQLRQNRDGHQEKVKQEANMTKQEKME